MSPPFSGGHEFGSISAFARKYRGRLQEGLGVKEIVASGLCTYKELRYWREKYDLERRWRNAYHRWLEDMMEEAVGTFGKGEYSAWRQMIVKRWKRLPAPPRRVKVRPL